MDVTASNVGLPALDIKKPDCFGYLSKCGRTVRTWKKRYCVLKDACIYYYKNINSSSAQGKILGPIPACEGEEISFLVQKIFLIN